MLASLPRRRKPAAVVLLIDHEGPSYLLAVEKKTGKTLWKTDRDSRNSYTSPLLVPVGKAEQIVCSSSGSVDGYDPVTGKLLWSFDDVGGNNVGVPFPVSPGRFLISGRPGMHNEHEKEAKRSNLLLSIEQGKEQTFTPTVAWKVPTMPSFANPVAYRGVAYWVNNAGVVSAYDVKSGAQLFAERIKQTCWAAPLGFGDRVYFFGKDGLTTVLQAGPSFKVLATNALWEASSRDSRDDGGHGTRGGKPDAKPGSSSDKAQPAKDAKKPEAKKERPERGPGGKMFADPIQYGVGVVNGSMVIRSGPVVYCLRQKN